MIRRGDPLSKILANDYNDLLAMLGRDKSRRHIVVPHVPPVTGLVWVKNTTADDRAAFDVMGLDAPIFNLDQVDGAKFEGVQMKAVEPTGDHSSRFAILQEPAPANDGFARAIVAGATVAKVNVTSTSHTHATCDDGETVLQSGASGPVLLLHEPTSTGEQLCPVVIDRSGGDLWLCKADANVASGASGTFSIWTGTAGSETDSGDNLTAYNRTGLQIDSGTWALVLTINGQKYAEPWQCPA